MVSGDQLENNDFNFYLYAHLILDTATVPAAQLQGLLLFDAILPCWNLYNILFRNVLLSDTTVDSSFPEAHMN